MSAPEDGERFSILNHEIDRLIDDVRADTRDDRLEYTRALATDIHDHMGQHAIAWLAAVAIVRLAETPTTERTSV